MKPLHDRKQSCLADGLMVEHAELDELSNFIGWRRIESMLSYIHNKRMENLTNINDAQGTTTSELVRFEEPLPEK